MRNVPENNRRENQNSFRVQKHSSELFAVNKIIWKNMVQPERSQAAIKHGACALNVG
jgi:hypothetical protein